MLVGYAADKAQKIADLYQRYCDADTPVAQSRALSDLGGHWRARGYFSRARTCFEQAVALNPQSGLALEGLGTELLRAGDIKSGMPIFEAGRWSLEKWSDCKRPFDLPYWDGRPLEGKRLLVWAEQGLGDQIIQMRVLSALLDQGAHVTLEASGRLFELLESSIRSKITCVPRTTPISLPARPNNLDVQTSALSAWRFLDDLAAPRPYLFANKDWSQQYKATWEHQTGPKVNVGLSWFSAAEETGAYRSLDLSWLAPLARYQQQARFHSLQYGIDDLQAEARKLQVTLCHDPDIDPFKDLGKLAAYLGFMDLVITIDTATAHLAAALGVRTWLLLPKSAYWYWGLHPHETQLYPHVRLFRAQEDGQWDDVLLDVYTQLTAFMAARDV